MRCEETNELLTEHRFISFFFLLVVTQRHVAIHIPSLFHIYTYFIIMSGATTLQRHCHRDARHMRIHYQQLKHCQSTHEMDHIWTRISAYRASIQSVCHRLLVDWPDIAIIAQADKYLWGYVYYTAITECRKRLGLHVQPLAGDTDSIVFSEISSSDDYWEEETGSSEGSVGQVANKSWQRKWWTITLFKVLREAIGVLSGLFGQLTACRLDSTHHRPIDFTSDYIQNQTPLPSALVIARKLILYTGDIYRYQIMYLPLLDVPETEDTERLQHLAQLEYTRAQALYVDSGEACQRQALLAGYSTQKANRQFEMAFWQMSSQSYQTGHSLIETMDSHGQMEDPIEALTVTLVNNANNENIHRFMQANNNILDAQEMEMQALLTMDVNRVETEFWKREYQLSVLLAGLLAMVGENEKMRAAVHGLAKKLVQKQTQCLLQCKGSMGYGMSYVLAGVCVWVDIWRSTDIFIDRDLLDSLSELAQQDAVDPQTVLPHDIALLGWTQLRPIQQNLQYSQVTTAQLNLGDDGIWMATTETLNMICSVVSARIRLLLQNVGTRHDSGAASLVSLTEDLKLEPLLDPFECTWVVPDAAFWSDNLDLIHQWISAQTYVVVLAPAVSHQLSHRELSMKVIMDPGELDGWDDAQQYLVAADDEDEETPTHRDVATDMQGVLSCALRLSRTHRVLLATDSDELQFYGTWFALASLTSTSPSSSADTAVTLDTSAVRISSIND